MNSTQSVKENHSESEAKSLAANGQNAEAAAKYARIGELLLVPEGIQYADEMFDKALQADASNAVGSDIARKRIAGIKALRRRSGHRVSDREVVQILLAQNEMGVLTANNELSRVGANVTESLQHLLDLREIREKVCLASSKTRPQSLMGSICIGWKTAENVQLSIDLLSGPQLVELGKNAKKQPVIILMDLTNVLRNPPRDLKEHVPTTFDARGNIAQIKDETMGGLFPNADIVEKTKQVLSGSGIKLKKTK